MSDPNTTVKLFDRWVTENPPRIAQGNYAEAERLYKRSQAIREKVLGPDHPDVASVLNNRAELLQCQVRSTRCFYRTCLWRANISTVVLALNLTAVD